MFDLEEVVLRMPTLEDGMDVYRLIESCPPLDTNSSYCNLLQCSHFAGTSVLAEVGGRLIGFISGYIIPERPNTLFVWQVAVSEQGRGLGLASRMLTHLLARKHCAHIQYVETSIAEDNKPSRALFQRLAETLSANIIASEWMDKAIHFDGLHDSEPLIRVGPFNVHS